jgi:Glyoxalase-like domain
VVKNRIHLDVIPPGNQQQEIARLVELAASVAGNQPGDAGWVALIDPEGNEFCVEAGGLIAPPSGSNHPEGSSWSGQ